MWQFAPLRPDSGLRATGWPQIPDRLARAAALADGYRLGRDARAARGRSRATRGRRGLGDGVGADEIGDHGA
jgi:hypothetical protein